MGTAHGWLQSQACSLPGSTEARIIAAMASYERRTWWSQHDMTTRLQEGSFLEAAVNAAFLIAAADGAASELEYDALLDRLEILGGVDRDAIDQALGDAAHLLESEGPASRLARIAELLPDRAAGAAALRLALAVALADDEVTADERTTAGQLIGALGLAGVDLDAVLAEVHG